MNCIYCGTKLTKHELSTLAEAMDISVEALTNFSEAETLNADIMCDQCANGSTDAM